MTNNTNSTAAQSTEAKIAESQTEEARTIIMDALEGIQEKIAVPAAAREFVAHQAAAARDGAEAVQEGAASLNAHVEKATLSLVGSYANFTRGLIDMTAANVGQALAAVEKLAAARSLPDAMAIQADYLRDSTTANFERVQSAIEAARDNVTEAGAAVRDAAAKTRSGGKKAA